MHKDNTSFINTLQPIRVLHIFAPNFRTRFAGPVVQWKYYFNHWDDPGVVHHVLDTATSQLLDARTAFNSELAAKQQKSSRWERFFWIHALIISLIKHRKTYDLLHVHVLWWGSLLLGSWAKHCQIPTIYESVLLGEDTPGGILQEHFGRFKVRCLGDYTGILAISDALAGDYLDSGFDPGQVFLLMNSVDTDFFHPAASSREKGLLRKKFGLPGEAKILLFVGSVIHRKGLDILVRGFIKAARKDQNLHLVIAGACNKNENPSLDEGFVQGLKDLVKRNGLSEKVSFLGLIQDRDQLIDIYRCGDVFLFPSRSEGLPTVVLEAMAAGLPVVCSRLPGLEKVISHGENGLFVPIGDADALQDAALELANKPALAERLAQNARHYVEKQHNFNAWQESMSRIYRELVQIGGSR